MPRASNGRIPADWLVTLDTGRGRHVTLPTPAVRWYLLRRNVKARTGVTLYITDGMNAYRDWDEQGVGRRNACNSGNCNAAAAQGYSSHGGTWTYGGRLIDATAFDIGNYWAIPWDVFREECERVGLRVGLITKAIAGIEEPWHVIDLDPYGAPPMGLTLTRGADGVYRLEDEMPTVAEIFNTPVTKNADGGDVTLAQILTGLDIQANRIRSDVAGVPGKVWGHGLVHPLAGSKDAPMLVAAGDFLRLESAEHANTRAAVALVATGDLDYDRLVRELHAAYPQLDAHTLAVAAADEADRRERERLAKAV